MTRTEFEIYVDDFCSLKGFCCDAGCEFICEDVIDDDTYDDYVESDIIDSGYDWRRLAGTLSDLPTGFSWYCRNGTFDYDGLDDDDFERYKGEVFDWAYTNGAWDEEEDEELQPFDPDPVPDRCAIPAEPEAFDPPPVDFAELYLETSRFASASVAHDMPVLEVVPALVDCV